MGITHTDTSDYYGPYLTNQIIRQALYPYPDGLHGPVHAVRSGA